MKTTPFGQTLKRTDRFQDAHGKIYEVWMVRYGVVHAHPVENGRPVVNSSTAERWSVTAAAEFRNPEYRTDLFPTEPEGNVL